MKADWSILVATALLAVFGLAMQTRTAGEAPSVALFALGGAAFAVCAFACAGTRLTSRLRGRGAWIAWGVAVALMVMLIVFGRRYRGGLYLPGRLNPSETVKFCVAACASGWLAERRTLAAWFGSAAAGGLLCGLIAVAGDFGLLAQLALTVAAMLFASSWWKGILAFAAIGGGFALAAAHPVGHLATRFGVWRDPLSDMTGAGWQTLQGLAAVVGGGVAGAGFKMGDVDAVPIASSDFVYAALAKDLGLVGCGVVLALWLAVLLRGLVAASRRCSDGDVAGALFATGLVASLGAQLLLNVAGVLNALPMTGITLPLVSHGGASFVVTLAMCGALFGISRNCGKLSP